MSLLEILQYPDSFLRKKTKIVKKFDEELKKIAEDMFETMIDARGIGLAASQVGIDLQIFVMNTSIFSDENEEDNMKEKPDIEILQTGPLTVINPVILSTNEKLTMEEGCLSISGIREEVTRPKKITVKFQNSDGEFCEKYLENLDAICFQHELDHLNGKLFIDHLSMLKREMIKKQFRNNS